MDDEYIRLLKALREDFRNDKAMSFEEFKHLLKGYKIKQHPDKLHHRIFDPYGGGKFHIGLDAYMMLLEYEELSHALKQSRQATRIAIAAIVISIVVGIVPVILWLIDREYFC